MYLSVVSTRIAYEQFRVRVRVVMPLCPVTVLSVEWRRCNVQCLFLCFYLCFYVYCTSAVRIYLASMNPLREEPTWSLDCAYMVVTRQRIRFSALYRSEVLTRPARNQVPVARRRVVANLRGRGRCDGRLEPEGRVQWMSSNLFWCL